MLSTAIRALVRVAMAAAVLFVALSEGRRAGLVASATLLAVLFILVIWLPRAAHRAFRGGDYNRARLLYKVLRLWVLRQRARDAVDVSLAACALAREDWTAALAQLDRMEPERLGPTARAAWLNNRAYALARSGEDHHGALSYAEQAIALRPDVAGFRHTRGLALLGVGRTDEAIAELDRLWSQLADQSDDVTALEAERCYDLARAWSDKGEKEYATDYYQRVLRAMVAHPDAPALSLPVLGDAALHQLAAWNDTTAATTDDHAVA
ncbi:MAG: tetratricopeptide repeat protein, partial [Myxococcota bacterium]